MLLLQFKIENTTRREKLLIPKFCNWIIDLMYMYIDTTSNRRRVSIRLDYLLNSDMIRWTSQKDNITVNKIFKAIHRSMMYERTQKGIWKIKINPNVLIPYSTTSIDVLIRFLTYGDIKYKAIGVFNTFETEFNHSVLKTYWDMFIFKNLKYRSEAKIIAR